MAAGKNKARSFPIMQQYLARFQPYRREIAGVIQMLFSVITLLSLLSLNSGSFSGWWANFFSQLFGWGAIPAILLLGAFGAFLTFGRVRENSASIAPDIVIGLELLFVSALALTHLLAVEPGEYAARLAREGGGGGFVGWGVSNFLVEMMGVSITMFFLFMIGLASLGMTFRLNITDAAYWADLVTDWAQRRLNQPPEEIIHPPEPAPPEPAARKRSKKGAKQKVQKLKAPQMSAEAAIAAMPKTRRALPPLDLLSPSTKDPTHGANARYQAQLIEETLGGFGIPVEVAEINSGPTVTQFGLKLGTIERKLPDGTLTQQRIRVNKVVALNNDLALALSAAPI